MLPFSNILVGIDLSQYDPKTFQPGPVARAVARRALWLGERASARLTFLSALNLTEENLPHLDPAEIRLLTTTAQQNAGEILSQLVSEAQKQEITAEAHLALGGGWLELVRQALRGQHDLILIGTRDRKGLGRMLFGSTAVKVVRRSPCPVWVAKPETTLNHLNILVASDLSAVADECLRLTLQFGRLAPATIHLLHVVDFPLDHIWSTGLPDAREEAYRRDVRQKAEEALKAQVERVGAGDRTQVVQVHLVDDPGGLPDEGILRFIQTHAIDLLVMGTQGRSGVAGIMIGNTAERILPELSCSLLAIKPAGFVCPLKP
jgi:universal stress protein E